MATNYEHLDIDFQTITLPDLQLRKVPPFTRSKNSSFAVWPNSSNSAIASTRARRASGEFNRIGSLSVIASSK